LSSSPRENTRNPSSSRICTRNPSTAPAGHLEGRGGLHTQLPRHEVDRHLRQLPGMTREPALDLEELHHQREAQPVARMQLDQQLGRVDVTSGILSRSRRR
jgi:hypothetical protein